MKFSLIIVSIFFALNSIAQSVVVQPYLQNLTEQSVVVMWETEEANSWYLDWGVDQTFGQSLASQSTSLLNTGNFIQRENGTIDFNQFGKGLYLIDITSNGETIRRKVTITI